MSGHLGGADLPPQFAIRVIMLYTHSYNLQYHVVHCTASCSFARTGLVQVLEVLPSCLPRHSSPLLEQCSHCEEGQQCYVSTCLRGWSQRAWPVVDHSKNGACILILMEVGEYDAGYGLRICFPSSSLMKTSAASLVKDYMDSCSIVGQDVIVHHNTTQARQ